MSLYENLYVSAGFGELITRDWFDRIRSIAHGVRQDIPSGLHASAAHALVRNVTDAGLDRAIFLINGWQHADADGANIRESRGDKPTPGHCHDLTREVLWACDRFNLAHPIIEVGNEIDIDPVYKHDRSHLSECVSAVYDAIKMMNRQNVPLIAGSVSNVDRDGGMRHLRAWLRDLHARYWIGVHPYRTTRTPTEFKGYATPNAMKQDLLTMLGGRPFAISESGWHDGVQYYHTGIFGLNKERSRFCPDDVADFARWDLDFWRAAGAELYCWYQVRDGRVGSEAVGDHFGAYKENGDPKPVARVLEELVKGKLA